MHAWFEDVEAVNSIFKMVIVHSPGGLEVRRSHRKNSELCKRNHRPLPVDEAHLDAIVVEQGGHFGNAGQDALQVVNAIAAILESHTTAVVCAVACVPFTFTPHGSGVVCTRRGTRCSRHTYA